MRNLADEIAAEWMPPQSYLTDDELRAELEYIRACIVAAQHLAAIYLRSVH